MSRPTAGPIRAPRLAALLTIPIPNRSTSPTARPDLSIALPQWQRPWQLRSWRRPDARRKGCRRCRGRHSSRSTSPARNSTAPNRRPGIMRIRRAASSVSPSISGRLYYAVADGLQIWSVEPERRRLVRQRRGDRAGRAAVRPARAKFQKSPSTSKDGCSSPTGRRRPVLSTSRHLSVPAIGRVLRYAIVEIMPNGRRIWQLQPDEYAIGFPPDFRNGNGGVAIGYDYDHSGALVPGSCGGFMWATGESLRQPADPALAAQLGQSGPLDVNGLQGNGSWRIRPDNAPPLRSYFIDYDDRYDDPAERGHMGDVDIERLCSAAQHAGSDSVWRRTAQSAPRPSARRRRLPPGHPKPPPPTPPGGCKPGEVTRAGTNECVSCSSPNIQINGRCCGVNQIAATAACSNSSCPAGQTAMGPSNFCCNSSQVYSGADGAQACCSGQLVNGKCSTPTTPNPPITDCAKGYVPIGAPVAWQARVTPAGVCCPAGEAPGGPNKSQCEKIIYIPIKRGPQCCASGIPTASGKCCPPANVTTSGVCCAGPVDPENRKDCMKLIPLPSVPTAISKMPDGSCCNNRFIGADGKSCMVSREACPAGQFRDATVPARRCRQTCAPGNCPSRTGELFDCPTAGREHDCVAKRAGRSAAVRRAKSAIATEIAYRAPHGPRGIPPRVSSCRESRCPEF